MENAQKLEDSYPQLDDARSQLDDGWAELRKGRRKLDENWAELDKARRKLVDGQEKLDAAWADLVSGRQELADSRKKLDDGWQEYWDGKARLADQTAEAQQKLSDAYRELIDGEANYRAGLADYESGKSEADEKLSDAQQKLSDAGRKVSEIESCKWYILGREANLGYAAFESNSQRHGQPGLGLPRDLLSGGGAGVPDHHDPHGGGAAPADRLPEGVGLPQAGHRVKYVGYGFFSSAAGGVLGLFLGCTAIPLTIYTAWGTLYTLGSLIIPVYPLISSISVLAAVAVVALSALAACFSALAAVPAQLMRPKAPPAGKRVLLERVRPVWRRLSFARKVTVRNLFRYKKRFWMTVIGIGGCTALLVAGFGLRNSLFDVLDLQYGKIDLYSARIGLADHVTQDELAGIGRVLDESGVSRWALFRQESITVKSGTNSVDASLLAPADENRLGDFIRLVHRKGGASVTLGSDGAVITEKLASLLHVSAGDTIRLDGDGEVEVPVADITENYILHDVYLSGHY
jgi:putative ABC transport system permease protein